MSMTLKVRAGGLRMAREGVDAVGLAAQMAECPCIVSGGVRAKAGHIKVCQLQEKLHNLHWSCMMSKFVFIFWINPNG